MWLVLTWQWQVTRMARQGSHLRGRPIATKSWCFLEYHQGSWCQAFYRSRSRNRTDVMMMFWGMQGDMMMRCPLMLMWPRPPATQRPGPVRGWWEPSPGICRHSPSSSSYLVSVGVSPSSHPYPGRSEQSRQFVKSVATIGVTRQECDTGIILNYLKKVLQFLLSYLSSQSFHDINSF